MTTSSLKGQNKLVRIPFNIHHTEKHAIHNLWDVKLFALYIYFIWDDVSKWAWTFIIWMPLSSSFLSQIKPDHLYNNNPMLGTDSCFYLQSQQMCTTSEKI